MIPQLFIRWLRVAPTYKPEKDLTKPQGLREDGIEIPEPASIMKEIEITTG
jgi:hypothetical protein